VTRIIQQQWDYLAFAGASLIVLVLLIALVPAARRPVLAAVIGVITLVVLSLGWVFVNRAAESALRNIESMVNGYAETYASELALMGHEHLDETTPADDPNYLRMIEAQQRWLAVNPAIADIYTIKALSDGELAFIVDSETDYDRNGTIEGDREQRTAIGERVSSPDTEVRGAMRGATLFAPNPITDRWGSWVSSYTPLRDQTGRIDAVVGVDYEASRWIAARASARRSVMIYLTGFIVLLHMCSMAFIFLSRSLDRARHAERAAAAANAAKTSFLANMSHEIRTPMTAILGYSDLLQDPDLSEPERIAHVRTIRRSARHLLSIVNDVLDIARLEAGRLAVERIPVSPVEITDEVYSLMRLRASEKGLQLKREIKLPIPGLILSDPLRVRQILTNLVGNAVKFTGTGTVTLRLSYQPNTSMAIFEVVDTGIGISPEQLQRLFQPFAQADSSMTRRFGGSGLGLHISQRLAQMLGGHISVDSAPGAGSTFMLHLPAPAAPGAAVLEVSPPPAEESMASSAALPRLTGRILLADDGLDNQRLAAFHLRRAGAVVRVVTNGRSAVDAALDASDSGAPFDLILMDMQMPELDGYSAAALLRASGYRKPIVAFTAHAMSGERERCLDAGCDDYITKPFEPAGLVGTCARWIRSNEQGSAQAA
jgi:signal transduction histidine kinase